MGAVDHDVVVVGAGTAGANAAYQFARRGRRVLLVERRSAPGAGAQWHNGVLDRHFLRAGLEPPAGAERAADQGGAVHLRATDPRTGPTLHDPPTVRADMALLGRRLRDLGADAGVELVDQVQGLDVGVDDRTGRIRSLTMHRDGHPDTTITASLFVDASGRRGVLRRHAADLAAWCPAVRGDELCSATDEHREVADPAGAEAFLHRHGARPGDAVTVVGLRGGFSTCAITVSRDLDHLALLVGCLANGRYGSGPRMVAEVLRREPWIGPATTSGTGVIPLRRPYARTTAAGVALVGDSAAQVFPAHGSGIGVGLIAGTVLAEGLADVDDPGDPHQLWARYQAPFQREIGGDLAAYDVLRRTTTRLGSAGVDALLRAGIMDEHTTRAGLDQRWATPPPAAAARSATRLARHPRVGAVMLPGLARAQGLRAHVARYPERLDLDALARWDRGAERLLGPLPR